MKTKLYLAFLILSLVGLVSILIFTFFIIRDFDAYVTDVRDDQVYWIKVSVDGAYHNGRWDSRTLSEAVHWAMMMGLDIKVLDAKGVEVVHPHHVMESLSPAMKRRMEEHFQIHGRDLHRYKKLPILSDGQTVGTLLVQPFPKKELAEKEAAFRNRVKYFLYTYLAIAALGSVLAGFALTQYISRPVLSLKKASERIATGDLTSRVSAASFDELGDLAKTFNKMAESLEREETIRKHLTSNVAHELRTPLTIMKTQVEAISDGIVRDTRTGLENIAAEIDKLITLVKGIEDITAAEASFFAKGQLVEIDLKEFIAGLVQEMLPSFQNKGLYLRVHGEKELKVLLDLEKLERILKNLLSNALKFTDKGGSTISYDRDGDHLVIEVSDTGRGISETDLPLVFNRFYRANDANAEGIGLGLAIAKELAAVMGGELSVTSEIGKGATFKITLPIG